MKDSKVFTDREILDEVIKLLNPRKRRASGSGNSENIQEVKFEVSNNGELRYIISCLLRVCIISLESDNEFISHRLANSSKQDIIATILDLADSLLPDAQLESYDAIEKLVLSFLILNDQ